MSDPTNPSSSTANELQSDNNPIVNDCIKLFSIKDYVLESQVISTLIEFFQVAKYVFYTNLQHAVITSDMTQKIVHFNYIRPVAIRKSLSIRCQQVTKALAVRFIIYFYLGLGSKKIRFLCSNFIFRHKISNTF